MAYPTLEKLFYKDASSERFQHHEEQLKLRLESESTFRTGIELENGELFCAVPRELSLANELVLRRERRVSALWRSLPTVALGAYLRGLILDEVVSSNEIEGVHSTRRQIEIALESAESAEREHAPFREFALLYLGLTDRDNPPAQPQTPLDIRDIYDAIVRDALDKKDRVAPGHFRTGPVVIEDHRGKELHRGVNPESRIVDLLTQMIALEQSADIPEIYSALLAHFLFEYIHPFYDGNGRTGRYLLALSLSRPLSTATVLSLSRIIAENKTPYYKAFDVTERRLNCSEATHFVMAMLDLIGKAQEQIIEDLEGKGAALTRLSQQVNQLDERYTDRERDLLFYLGQVTLFGAFGEIKMAEVAGYLNVSTPTARKTFESLSGRDLLVRVSERPAIYRLSRLGKEALGIPD